jgi:hypothetical protein
MYLCIIDKRAFAWYVYVYLYPVKFNFDIYIFENKGLWGFQIWIFSMHMCCIIMHIRGLGDGRFNVSLIARSGGGNFAIIVKLFTWEFLQVFTSSYINLFKCIEAFYILLLAFDVIGVAWEFLQVLASSYINLLIYGFYFWLSMPVLLESLALISFHCCVKAFASSCVNHQCCCHC